MIPAPSPTVRPFQPGDLEQLLRIKCAVFDGLVLDNERRRWEWEFDRNPALDPAVPRALVLETAAGPVGFFALIPYRVQMGRDVRLGLAGVDLCILPEHQGGGYSRVFVRRWMEPGFCSFPFTTALGAPATHLMTKAGGTLLGGRDESIAWAWFVGQCHEEVATQGFLPVERFVDFDAGYDSLWERVRRHHRLLLVRDRAAMNWRYRDFPFETPQLLRVRGRDGAWRGVGVVQVDRRHDRLYLCELLTEPDDRTAQLSLLVAVTEIARDSGHFALYYSTRDRRQVPAIETVGFRSVPGDVPTFLGRVNHQPGDGILTPQDWYTSLGDGDQLFNVGEPEAHDR